MGHDIFAGTPCELDVAYLRRGAFDRLNIVLYDALDRMDMHAGASGCGSSDEFTVAQLNEAKNKLLRQGNDGYVGIERPRNAADDLFDTLAATLGSEGTIECFDDDNGVDISREIQFLTKCIDHLIVNNLDKITIFFG